MVGFWNSDSAAEWFKSQDLLCMFLFLNPYPLRPATCMHLFHCFKHEGILMLPGIWRKLYEVISSCFKLFHIYQYHYFEIDSFKESENAICQKYKAYNLSSCSFTPLRNGPALWDWLIQKWAFTGYSALLGIIWEEKEGRGFFMPYRRIHLFERVSGVDRNILNNAYFW